MLNLEALKNAPLRHEPYEYVIVEDFLTPAGFDGVTRDFPPVPGPGSHPPGTLDIHGQFADLLAEMDGPEFRKAVEEKFAIDLTSRPTMFTVRGFCRANDGKIHTDSETKIITVLLYLNERKWDSSGGRLRVLKSGTDLEDYAAEVNPNGGTLLVFKRSANSWHGHHSYEGPRRAIQMNWVTDSDVVRKEQWRHSVSTWTKRLTSLNFS